MFSYIQYTKKIGDELNDLLSENSADFMQKAKEQSSEVSIPEVTQAVSNSEKIKESKPRIHSIYQELKSTAVEHEVNSEQLRIRLINIHANLENSIDLLQNNCKYAVKICNQQDS